VGSFDIGIIYHMTWNYRIIHHDKDKHPYFAVHEVFYDDDGKIMSWTTDPINITGENKPDLIKTLRQMLGDVESEILIESHLDDIVRAIM
jgi:hypothetical protein